MEKIKSAMWILNFKNNSNLKIADKRQGFGVLIQFLLLSYLGKYNKKQKVLFLPHWWFLFIITIFGHTAACGSSLIRDLSHVPCSRCMDS